MTTYPRQPGHRGGYRPALQSQCQDIRRVLPHPCPAHRGDDDNLAIKDGDQGGLILPSRDWYDRRGEEIRLDFLLRPVPAVSATPGERLADPVAEPETLVAFIAETTPGGGVIAQMALSVLVFWLYMTAKLPESTWGSSSAASSCCLWPAGGPVVLGFGEPIAAAVMLGNVALGGFAYKTWMARQAES